MRTPSASLSIGVFLIVLNAVSFSQQPTRFACVGDYGQENEVQQVANLIASWHPDFVVTVGDNNYTANDSSAAAWDAEVGRYYGQFIRYPPGCGSAFAPGPPTNKFFPVLGNHDWDAGINGWQRYFGLPGNERYYDFVKGPVHLFVVSSDSREPDGIASNSQQALWLQNRLANSASPWKIVLLHHPPFSSGNHGNHPTMQWPFKQWGASLVLAGHDHTYERIVKDGLNYIVNGLGGRPLYAFNSTPEPGSVVRYNSRHGAVLVTATPLQLTIKAYSVLNFLIDSLTLSNPQLPVQLASFTGTFVSGNRVRLHWRTITETNNYGFEIQKRIAMHHGFQTIPNSFVPGHGTTITPHDYTFIDSNASVPNLSYRLRIIDLNGVEEYSEPISVSAPTANLWEETPTEFRLEQNYPNPFNPSTTIRYSLHKEAHATVRVFDQLGREVATLVNGVRNRGEGEIVFNTAALASGSYYYRLDADGFSATRHLIVVK